MSKIELKVKCRKGKSCKIVSEYFNNIFKENVNNKNKGYFHHSTIINTNTCREVDDILWKLKMDLKDDILHADIYEPEIIKGRLK